MSIPITNSNHFPLKRLTWANYQELQSEMNLINHTLKVSALTMLSWVYYGIRIEFCIQELNGTKIIYLFGKFNRFLDIDKASYNEKIMSALKYGDHFLIAPVFDCNAINPFEGMHAALAKLIQRYPVHFDLIVEAVTPAVLDCFHESDYHQIYKWTSNFIYNLNKMKTFAGKQLQKKRNHYNYFVKTYSPAVIVQKIQPSDKVHLLEFATKMTYSYESTDQQNELLFLRTFLENFDPQTMTGTVIRTRSKNEVIAFTIGYLHNDIYEVFFEKANHAWRGLYQFIIAENLRLNEIEATWMDRQDDVGVDNIRQSKMSYYPEMVLDFSMITLHNKNFPKLSLRKFEDKNKELTDFKS